MLDDLTVIAQRDPEGALGVVVNQYKQDIFQVDIQNRTGDRPQIDNIIVAGMGGSALAAILLKTWLKSELKTPMEVVRTYNLPAYVGTNTLVIASSYSGNTEETVSCMNEAVDMGAQVVVIASGGKLMGYAKSNNMTFVQLPADFQPRMAVIDNLRALVALLAESGIIGHNKLDEIAGTADWLKNETANWASDVPTDKNYAKQLALMAVGKTPIFYGGALTAPVAYKWKISFNENAKNVAFWNELPEFDHNELTSWSSHPVEKPFAVFNIISNLEHPRILRRFEIGDRLLSGSRPKAILINLAGQSAIQQLLWGSILADFASIYTAILNNVDPIPVPLVEKLKKELE